MSRSVRVFIPAFAGGIGVMTGLFYWMLETTSWFLLALSILGGAAIGLLVMLDNRRAANDTAFVPRLKLISSIFRPMARCSPLTRLKACISGTFASAAIAL